FLGPESGLAVPDGEGGVDLYVSTQWLHVDRDPLAASLDLPPDTGRRPRRPARPVTTLHSRGESFFGHVHRHPARLRYEHGATRDGRLVYVKARILLAGGGDASGSTAVCSNAPRL